MKPKRYLSKAQVASEIMGVKSRSLTGYRLPEPDVIIGGEPRPDGTLPRGVVGGYEEQKMRDWWEAYPKRGNYAKSIDEKLAKAEAEVRKLRAAKKSSK